MSGRWRKIHQSFKTLEAENKELKIANVAKKEEFKRDVLLETHKTKILHENPKKLHQSFNDLKAKCKRDLDKLNFLASLKDPSAETAHKH
ncbi:uncharacterized protein V6R79_016778 [Siganus canaliculatus]